MWNYIRKVEIKSNQIRSNNSRRRTSPQTFLIDYDNDDEKDRQNKMEGNERFEKSAFNKKQQTKKKNTKKKKEKNIGLNLPNNLRQTNGHVTVWE